MPNDKDRFRNVYNGQYRPDFIEDDDWEARFKNAKSLYDLKGKNGVYMQFCRAMFGNKNELSPELEKTLDEISVALESELLAKGFTFMQNPFIQYIYNFIVKHPEVITKEKYNLIHNAYIDKLINDDDLKGRGFFKKDDLIYTPDLFKLDTKSMRALLELQDDIKDMSGETVRNLHTKEKYNNFEKDGDKRQFAIDLFRSGLSPKEFNTASHSDKTSPLRPLKDIKQILAFIDVTGKDEDTTKSSWEDLVKDIDKIDTIKQIVTALLLSISRDEKKSTLYNQLRNDKLVARFLIVPNMTDKQQGAIIRKLKTNYNIKVQDVSKIVNALKQKYVRLVQNEKSKE